MHRIAWLLGSFLLALSCGERAPGGGAAGVLRVGEGTVQPTLLLTGELEAEDSVPMIVPNANVWPMTIRWLAEDGTRVRAGDPIVEFDSSQLTGNLESLRSAVVEASNRLEQTVARVASERADARYRVEVERADWAKARTAAEIPREIVADQDWARRQLDLRKAAEEKKEAEAALEAASSAGEAAIEVDRLALAKARLALRRAERGLGAMTLTAPVDGIVLISENPQEDRPFRSGDATWPGLEVASLPDLASLRVRASLFDVDDGRVAAGASVSARLDAFPGEELRGTIVEVAEFAEATSARSSRRSFRVIAEVEGLDPDRMRPGMSVLLVSRSESDPGPIVPRTALTFDSGSGGATARVVPENGSPVDVVVGECDAELCRIDGIEPGVVLRRSPEDVT